MIVNNLAEIPSFLNYNEYGYDVSSLSDYDLQWLKDNGIDEVWYWYGTGSYEGGGHLIARKGILFDCYDLGHCSCYGPGESLNEFNGVTLKELEGECSEELWKRMETLLSHIKEK